MVASWLRDGKSGVQFPEVTCPFGGEKEIEERGDEISTGLGLGLGFWCFNAAA